MPLITANVRHCFGPVGLQGQKTTISWLASLFTGIVADIFVTLPLIVVVFHVLLPLYIRHKLRLHAYGTGDDPYFFQSAFIPPGPAYRVAIKHPTWLCSRYITRALSPKHVCRQCEKAQHIHM